MRRPTVTLTQNSICHRLRGLVRGDGLRAQLIRGGMGSASIQALNRVLALALGIVLARALGAEGYGVYAYAFAIMSLLMVVAEAGVPTLLMREVAASQGRGEWGLLRGALIRGGQFVALAATIVSVVGLLVLWWLADGLSPQVLYTTGLMLLVLPVAALAKTVAHAMRGLHRVVIGQAVDMLLRPLLVLFIVAVIFPTWPGLREPQIAMAAQLVAALFVLLVGSWVLRHFLPDDARSAPAEYRGRQWLKSALPFTLIGGAGIINSQADIIMLGWFRSSEEVGIYRVAVQGGVFVAFALQAFSPVLAPHFSKLYATAQVAKLSKLYKRSSMLVVLITLPILLAFVFFGAQLVKLVFGVEYMDAALPLAILAGGYAINVSFGPVGLLLQMAGNESITARVLWVTSVLNVVMNLLLIPFYGLVGASIATAASVSLYHAALRYYAWRIIGF